MGNIKKQNLVVTLLLLTSLFFFLSSSSSSNEFQYSKNLGWSPSDTNNNNNVAPISPYGDDEYHDYMLKNSEPPYFMKKQTGEGGDRGLMTTKKKTKKALSTDKKKTTKKMKTRSLNLKNRERSSSDNWSRKRTYSAMLPKGFVPPSGSSPCHNTYPNSVTFFCHLSTTTTSKIP